MKLAELFEHKVTRDIPPVVYFHDQSPQRLAQEVGEYIITGGFPEGHPHKARVPSGIHEQYVKLLSTIATELDKPGGPDLPASWISGFYGSGKSSFAKLLGLALDGVALPDGHSLAEAWLARDTTPLSRQLRDAYAALRKKVDPISVVFDIGSSSESDEHVHSAVVRQTQRRLGYCHDPYVAEMELRLERDNHWPKFERTAQTTLGKPWSQAKSEAFADDQFSHVMHVLFPERYVDPMAWLAARAGSQSFATSVEEATRAVRDMLEHRAKGKTLFVVVDEVSQYVHQHDQRMLKLQSFVSELGQRLRGKVWLLVTGQQKLEEGGDQNILGKMKDRFPEKLRVHLAATNIRDVVHKRLLRKKADAVPALRALFAKHRNDLRLFAYGCEDVSEDDFVEIYPLLPGHIELILHVTSALRSRSSRSQGDDQGARGLLQLLGELFRAQKLADAEVGSLVTLDQIYEVQHTALESDVQLSMTRLLHHCTAHNLPLAARAAKAVAMLELIQEDAQPTEAKLVASCLHGRVDGAGALEAVTEALEELRRHNLLGYSAKLGYKIQSSAAEEWEGERRSIAVSSEQRSEAIQEALKYLVSVPDKPRLKGQPFSLRVLFSDTRGTQDANLTTVREPACVQVDLRFVSRGERETEAVWINRSAESAFKHRLLWVVGPTDDAEDAARELCRSVAMVKRKRTARESMQPARQRLLLEEEARVEDLERKLQQALDAAFLAGELFFSGKRYSASELGGSFVLSLAAASERVLPELFPSFLATRVTDAEVLQLIEGTLSAPSPKLVTELGVLTLEAGKYEPTCHGVVPRGIVEHIEGQSGVSGARLLEHFGGPPYGYAPEVVRACVAGLLRAHRVRIQPESGHELSAVRDAGVREIFDKDRGFKRASFFIGGDDPVGPKGRARICKVLDQYLGLSIDRESDAIANAVADNFPLQGARVRSVFERLRKLPFAIALPYALTGLDEALTRCVGLSRYTDPTVRECLKCIDALSDGLRLLALYDSELTDAALSAVRRAHDIATHQGAQLEAFGALDATLSPSLARVREQLKSDRPWQDIGRIDADLAALGAAYLEQRTTLLRVHEEAVEQARGELKARDGFATLSAEQSHRALHPITEVAATTDAQALHPTLTALRDGFPEKLRRAREESNDRLDQLVSVGAAPVIRKLAHNLHNREIKDAADLERVLDELRTRALEQLQTGVRVRLI